MRRRERLRLDDRQTHPSQPVSVCVCLIRVCWGECASPESVGECVGQKRHAEALRSSVATVNVRTQEAIQVRAIQVDADARLGSSVRVTPSESLFHPSHGVSVDSSCTPCEQQSQALIQSSRPSFRVTCSEPLFPSHYSEPPVSSHSFRSLFPSRSWGS